MKLNEVVEGQAYALVRWHGAPPERVVAVELRPRSVRVRRDKGPEFGAAAADMYPVEVYEEWKAKRDAEEAAAKRQAAERREAKAARDELAPRFRRLGIRVEAPWHRPEVDLSLTPDDARIALAALEAVRREPGPEVP